MTPNQTDTGAVPGVCDQTSGGYPVILNGDHAEFEAEWAASGKPAKGRPDWPLPSFDARDWAEAFCKIATNLGYKDTEGKPIDEGWMIGWFANALMRGFDEATARTQNLLGRETVRAQIEAEARRYAEMYKPHSDGRNTFVIFADWIAALQPSKE